MANKPGVEFRPSLSKVGAAITRKMRELKDRTVPNRRIAVLLDAWVQRNFRSEGGEVGGWTPFKAGGRWIPGVGLDTSAKLLQHTGALRASFRPFYDANVVGIGSDLEYSEFHEDGTGDIPRRRMLPEERDVIEPIMNEYNRWFKDVLEKPLW